MVPFKKVIKSHFLCPKGEARAQNSRTSWKKWPLRSPMGRLAHNKTHSWNMQCTWSFWMFSLCSVYIHYSLKVQITSLFHRWQNRRPVMLTESPNVHSKYVARIWFWFYKLFPCRRGAAALSWAKPTHPGCWGHGVWHQEAAHVFTYPLLPSWWPGFFMILKKYAWFSSNHLLIF